MTKRDLFFVDREYNCPIPRTYWIETSSVCNLRCPFCPTAKGLYHNDVRMMSFRAFKRLFKKIKNYALYIYFHRHGEPTLNKDLFRMIRLAADHGGIYTLFSTNLNTLKYDRSRADELVASGISEIIASIDGASEETYTRYRRGGSFATAMHSLQALADAKVRLRSETPKLNWQFLINRFNEHEIGRARDMAEEAGAEIYFRLMDVWGEEDWHSSYHEDPGKFARLSSENLSSAGALDTDERNQIVEHARQLSMPDYAIAHVDDIHTHSHFPWWCSQVFHTMAINTDGSVSPCTEIADSRFNLGNLLTGNIDRLWNSPAFRRSRRYVMKKEVSGSLCEACVRGESACVPEG